MPAAPRTPAPPLIRRVPRLLLLAAVVLLVAFGAVVTTSVVQTRLVAASLETIRNELRPRAEAAYEMEINLHEVTEAVTRYVAERDSGLLPTIEAERYQLDSAVRQYYRAQGRSPGDTTGAQRLQALIGRHDSLSRVLIAFAGSSTARGAVAPVAQQQYRTVHREIASVLDREIQPRAIAEWHVEADRVLAISRRQDRIILSVALLGLLIAVSAGLLSARAHAAVDEARALAELSSQQKTEFASITAHELRSPLNAILGSLQLLASGRFGELSPGAARYLEMGERNAVRMLDLISELLELDKLEAGMLPLDRVTVRMGELVQSACAALEATAVSCDVRLRAESAERQTVTGDPARLKQVVTNLVSNAVKHAPRGSEVVARVVDLEGRVRVTVRDGGPGIRVEDRERIFQRFVQSGRVRQHSTGLGLTIAREIVHRHHGRIGVESEPGQGATFWFDVPADRAS